MRTLWLLLACLLVDARLAPRICYCVQCHGLGCGGWCRWCQ